jgi:urease accessory protein
MATAAPPPGLAMVRLLHLTSPALPVGAYAYSQGLEWLVGGEGVQSPDAIAAWIGSVARLALGRFELPLAARLHAAWLAGDIPRAQMLDRWMITSRETAELRAETLQMGHSLRRLLLDTRLLAAGDAPADWDEVSFPTAFAAAAVALGIDTRDMLTGYAWSWLENQVLAAVKLVPLGQVAGQRMLLALGETLPALVESALRLDEDAMSSQLPGLALASSRHETQYTRLFRS